MDEENFRFKDERLTVKILKNNYIVAIRRAFDVKRSYQDRLNNFEEALNAEGALKDHDIIIDHQKHGEIFR